MSVNKPRMRKWVAALRSGEYQQGKQALKTVDNTSGETDITFCCLGVACEIAVLDGLGVVTGMIGAYCSYDNQTGILPKSVIEYYGLSYSNPLICDESTATSANDRLNWDFSKIADEIETYYRLNEDDDSVNQTE